MKLKEWLNEWLNNQVKITSKERTFNKYSSLVGKYIVPLLGEYEIGLLSTTEMYRFSSEIKAKGLAPSTINCIITVLKSAWKTAMIMGIATKPIVDVIVRPPIVWKRTECFSSTEQRRLEKHIVGSHDKRLFGVLLSLYSGLRIGELLALTWDDVDLHKGTVTVSKSCRDSWQNAHYVKVIEPTKTLSSLRTIPLPRKIVSCLRELKRSSKCKYVVPGKTQYGAQVRNYQRAFDTLLLKLGIKHRSFHTLRHTFATRALEVGMDVRTLSELLGHKNPTVTLQRYAHSFMEHKAEMMNRLGRLLEFSIEKNDGFSAAERTNINCSMYITS